MEFMTYYTQDLLNEAGILSEYAQKSEVDIHDLKLAIECKQKLSFTRPLPNEFIQEIASQKNNETMQRCE